MKLLLSIVITALLAFVAGVYMPWWSLAVVSFLVAVLVHQTPARAFVGGFVGLFLLWGALAWWIDSKNQSLLSKKIASILPLGGDPVLLILVTALIAGLVAGMAALSGSFLRKV
ncbi:MAG TPA: hypothetical protein VG870_07000 [Chitinophagaceae bacterium]|nr:hypothetical protein [Chitinophagaceae bacterium]